MKRFTIALLAIVMLAGCSQMSQFERQTYTEGMASAQASMESWSYYSGVYTCAMGGSKITFPSTVTSAEELQKLVNNPVVITGIAKLDELAQKTTNPKTSKPYWSDFDWAMGCSAGVKGRMAVSEVVQIIKILWPQAAPFMPGIGQ